MSDQKFIGYNYICQAMALGNVANELLTCRCIIYLDISYDGGTKEPRVLQHCTRVFLLPFINLIIMQTEDKVLALSPFSSILLFSNVLLSTPLLSIIIYILSTPLLFIFFGVLPSTLRFSFSEYSPYFEGKGMFPLPN